MGRLKEGWPLAGSTRAAGKGPLLERVTSNDKVVSLILAVGIQCYALSFCIFLPNIALTSTLCSFCGSTYYDIIPDEDMDIKIWMADLEKGQRVLPTRVATSLKALLGPPVETGGNSDG